MNKYPIPQFDYEKDLAISRNHLDDELLTQAQKMFRYNSAHAQAQLDRDRAKQSLDVTKANLDSRIRMEATQAEIQANADIDHWTAQEAEAKAAKNQVNLEICQKNKIIAQQAKAQAKLTESAIDAKIRSSPSFIEAQTKLQEAEYIVNLTFAGVMAMNARRPCLEDLVRLFLSGYWAEPRVQGGEGMKAGAAQEASEAVILRGQELPTEINPVELPKKVNLAWPLKPPSHPVERVPLSPPPTPRPTPKE